MHLLLTRPEPDNKVLAQALEDLGHEVLREPLLSIQQHHDVEIIAKPYQAIIVTSANGARGFVEHPAAYLHRSVPVFAVGAATARVFGALDFMVADESMQGVSDLRAKICNQLSPREGPLLYIRGVHVAGTLGEDLVSAGFEVEEACLYEAVAQESFTSPVLNCLQNGLIEGVVLFSPRTAQIFCKLIDEVNLGNVLSGVTFYCLSQNVADACVFGDDAITVRQVIAKLPTQESLIASI